MAERRTPSDPIDSSEVFDAIRAAQESELARLEAELIREREQLDAEARRAAWHLARMHALQPIVAMFLQIMATSGNPGLEYYGGSRTLPPGGAGFFERLSFKPRIVRPMHFWPMASVPAEPRNWLPPPSIVALTTTGQWWRGQTGTAGELGGPKVWQPGSYSLSRRTSLDELAADDGYGSIGGPGVRGTVDRAVMGTIAALVNRHGLRWPASTR